MSATACQFCGKSLSRLSLRRAGDFCSREHREQYRLRQGMNRVREASEVTDLERRKERPQLIALQPAAPNAGSGKRRSTPDVPRLGGSPCDFLPAGPGLMAKLRPAYAGAVAKSGGLRSPDEAPRRTDPAPVRIRTRVEFKAVALPVRRFERVRLRVPGFDCLIGQGAGPQPRRKAGFDRPLMRERGEVPVRAVLLSLRGAACRLVAAVAPEMPRAESALVPAVPRGMAEAAFPSASLEPGVPMPPARRRTGKRFRFPSAGFANSRRLRAFSMPADRRGSEECFRADLATPAMIKGAGRVSPGSTGLAPCADVMCDLGSTPACMSHAKKRYSAPDFWNAIPAFFRIAVPLFDTLPFPPRCSIERPDRPFIVHRASRRTGRRRTFNVPQPPHSPAYPSWAAALLEASRSLGPAPLAPLGIAAVFAGRSADVRGYGALALPIALHGSVLPILRPWASTQGFGATRPSASAMPPRMPAPRGAATSAPRAEVTGFAGASPVMPATELGILSSISGSLEAANGAAVIEDNFGSGLGRWVGALADWRIDAAGVRPGSLALFSPSLGMRDYELEFLAKVEQRGMAWVCRAADLSNYYLLTISWTGEGTAQTLQLTRRAVIAGVAGPPVTVPVPLALRSKAAFRVQTCVSGADFTVAVEGQKVDGWTDSNSDSGGIGFLAGQEDRARLYWVKLSPRGTGFPGRRARPVSPVAGAGRV